MAKTGEISQSLKGASEVFQGVGQRGASVVRDIGAAPGTKAALGRFGKMFAYPAGLGAGVGVGAYAAGTGVKEGFGLNPANPADMVKQSTGLILFFVFLVAGLWVVGKYLAMRR